jgi:ABC-type Fe3+-hydroxamate transport system substrate-binding protein
VEIICALGAGDRLVGVGRYVTYPPRAGRLPRVGGLRDPDLEGILTLAPDLVILRGRQENVERLCHERGIAVYHDPTQTLAGLKTAIADLGRLLNRPAQADALWAGIQRGLGEIAARAAGRSAVRVLLAMRSPDRLANITTVARGSYLHEVLEISGGRNIFGELDVAYPQVSVEEIVARKPEVIIEVPGVAPSDGGIAMLAQWERLAGIPAVDGKRVHLLAEDYALVPSPRVVLLASKLFALLHPDALHDE